MKFEIDIPVEHIDEVVKQVTEMHNIALHNLGNSVVRSGDVEKDTEIANATKIIFDLVSVVTGAIKAVDEGQNPSNYNYGNVCCHYISK